MKKTLYIFLLVFLPNLFSSANCPSSREIWLNYQKAVREKASQKVFINLSQICSKCNIKDSTYTLILEKIAENFAADNEYEKAIQFINQAIVLNKSRQTGIDESCLESNYFCLGKYYNHQGENQKASDAFDLSILIAKKFPQKSKFLSKSYSQKAMIWSKIGDFEKAITQADIGINYGKQKGDKMVLGLCYTEKAKALNSLGKSSEAEAVLYKAIEVLEKGNAESFSYLAYAYYILAQNFKSKQAYSEAIILYQKAQKYFALSEETYMFSMTYISLGMAYYYLKDYNKALAHFNIALKTNESPYMKVNILDDIASAYRMKKEYPQAFLFFQKALTIAPIGFKNTSLFDNPSVSSLKRADFKSFYLTTLTDKAETWLEYYEKTKSPEHLKVALETYSIADKLIDIMRFEHTGTTSKLFWRSKTHSLYEQAIRTCFLLKNYDKAFYFFEKSKAILLNDRLNELTAKQQLSPEDLAKEVDFQQKIAELNKKLSSENENSEQYEDLQMQVLDIHKQQEQFIRGLETKNPTYFRYKYDTTLVSLDKVKKYLGNDQTLLEYFVGKNAIYALQVSDEKVNMYTIDVKNYADNATRFLSYCADNQKANRDFKGFLNVSNQLYRQLFTNIVLPKGRLIIAQDGFFIPFEALSKSAQKTSYLLNDYAISYTYSMQFLLKNLGEKSFSFRHKFMGMSPVSFSNNLNQTALSGSDFSLATITSNFIFGKNFNQQEATKNTFLNNAHNYQIVHLYTHAQADSTDQEPMIYFKDSVLKLSELSGLERFKTQLMVLSACKTAVGKNAIGEGILSLSRGFAALGIPATLTTLWSVENQATYTLNELFYRYLSGGYSKDISLQKAKLEFLQSQSGEKQLPTFWAAAVLVGDAEAISFNKFWFYLLASIILLLGGFWWYQKK